MILVSRYFIKIRCTWVKLHWNPTKQAFCTCKFGSFERHVLFVIFEGVNDLYLNIIHLLGQGANKYGWYISWKERISFWKEKVQWQELKNISGASWKIVTWKGITWNWISWKLLPWHLFYWSKKFFRWFWSQNL